MTLVQNSSIGVAKKFYAKFNGKRCIIKFSKLGDNQDLINEVIYYKLSKVIPVKVCRKIITTYCGKRCIALIFEYSNRDTFVSFRHKGGIVGKVRNRLDRKQQKELDRALILDYLMSQQDRHLSNLALVNDLFYPLFDNGECLGISSIGYWSNKLRNAVERWGSDYVKNILPINDIQYYKIIEVLKTEDRIRIFQRNFNKIYKGV